MTEVRSSTVKKRTPVRVLEREYGKKKVRLHVRGKDRIVLVEVIAPKGGTFELDPNYTDITAFRELL
jgi:hypothetical protein